MNNSDKNKQKNTLLIKAKAKEMGFLFCGISKATYLKKDAVYLDKWLSENKNAGLDYMKNNFDKRLDPRLLVDNAKSVITFLYNYFPEKTIPENSYYKISKYAYGKDYHYVIKSKLKNLIQDIHNNIGEVNARAFVDSAPILERAWAKRSGLGWIGKNSNLITKSQGSFFFISEIITDLELNYDPPFNKNYCGNCSLCIDACPTKAIEKDFTINANKCISYLTIELKDKISEEFNNKYEKWIFGCDICQNVCPWNRFSITHNEPDFLPNPNLFKMSKNDWEEITEEIYKELFRKTAVKRAKFDKFKNNINFIKKY